MQEWEQDYEYWLRSANEERGIIAERMQREAHKHYDILFKWKEMHKCNCHFATSVGFIVTVAATAATDVLLLLLLSADEP